MGAITSRIYSKISTTTRRSSARFLAAFDGPVEKGFRVNPNKTVTATMRAKMTAPVPYSPIGYYGKVNGNALEHLAGAVYSQEPSAMTVGEFANQNLVNEC